MNIFQVRLRRAAHAAESSVSGLFDVGPGVACEGPVFCSDSEFYIIYSPSTFS